MQSEVETPEVVTRSLSGFATQLRRMVEHVAFVQDGYVRVRDPDFLIQRLEQAASLIESLYREREKLREALRPFANLSVYFDATGASKVGGADMGKALRRARAALAEQPQ